ncbi:MAG TPA: hypothetical protein VFZ95_01770 [Steroidobacteraceae bacterium]
MNPQINELLIAYVCSAAGMLAGMLVMRAGSRAYWRWPVYSVMAMTLGVVLWSVLRKHVFPPEWALLHGRTLYFTALAIYVLLGLGAGTLLGRLTRVRHD